MVDVLTPLQELAANVVFHALISINCKAPGEAARREAVFRSDYFTACSNLFEVHHVHSGAEAIFGVLNPQTLAEVSPEMRAPIRSQLREMIIATVGEWIAHHQELTACKCSNVAQ